MILPYPSSHARRHASGVNDDARLQVPVVFLIVFLAVETLIKRNMAISAARRSIILRGLSFTGTGLTFLDHYEPLARGDWAIHRGAAIYFEGVENSLIDDCNFDSLGGNAVLLSGYNRHNAITHSRFKHIGDSAVAFVGRPEAVRMYLTWDDEELLGKSWQQMRKQMDLMPGPKTPDYPEDCSVEDSVMSDIGEFGKQTAGVVISMSHRITVSHCTIYNTPRAGVCINDGTWGGHIVEHCDIWETVRETGEHGPFNAWGRERQWLTEKGGADGMDRSLVLLDAMDTTHIRNNRIANFRKTISAGNWTIDLDDGSSNYAIYNNLSLGSTLKLREGYFRKVWNNIHVSPVEIGFHVWPPDSEDEFYNNITVVSGARPGQQQATESLVRPARMPLKLPWGKLIDRNLYWNVNSRTFVAADMNWDEWRKAGHDRSSSFADPQFIDPLHGDYRVQENSPALKLGFKNFPMDEFGHRMTRITPFGGEFEQIVSVILKADARGGEVRYTLDGTAPSHLSTRYETPITITATTTLRAGTFNNRLKVGSEEMAHFTRVEKVVSPSWLVELLRPGSAVRLESATNKSKQLWMGAIVKNVRNDPELIDATGGQDFGVFLESVPESSIIARWGLLRSDVIVEFDGKKIEDIEQLLSLAERIPSRVVVVRGYRKQTIQTQ